MEHLKDIQKKTQSIVTALYMVSDFMNDNEPVKLELRSIGVSLIKDVLSLQMSDRGEHYKRVSIVRYKIAELQTLISLGRTLGMVSMMNSKLLDDELVSLSHALEHVRPIENIKSKSFILPENLFKEEFKKETVLADRDTTSIHAEKSVRDYSVASPVNIGNSSFQKFSFEKNSTGSDMSHTNTLPKRTDENVIIKTEIKDNRKKEIMDTIKRQGGVSGVTIKDITKLFTDVSEKTIQRELTEMLQKGQIKKTGEKRWSRYYPL